MRVKFIGRDGSMGFVNGKVYKIRTAVRVNSKGQVFLWVYDMSSNLYCPYSNLEKMLDNWKILSNCETV